jgi:hypothetical protein
MKRARRVGAAAVAIALGLVVPAGHAHVGGRPHGHPHGLPGSAHEHRDDRKAERPTEEQMLKRISRVKQRYEEEQRNRSQRAGDRRRAQRKWLHRGLDGAPVTADVREELRSHARRTARLKRIRYLAAVRNDFDTVERIDKLLARDKARQERWWRARARAAAPPAPSAKPD